MGIVPVMMLVLFLVRHALIGFAIAALFVQLLVRLDIGQLGTLMAQSDVGVMATWLLSFFMGLTFASAQMGIAVLLKFAAPREDP